jgi:preprotein translocase subunit Sss1
MTPKEKAEELINKFSERRKILTETKGWVEYVNSSKAKGHALVAVDEILNINSVDKDFSLSHYWLDVKDEIQNL